LNTALVDSEKLLRLLSEPTEVDDELGATEFVVTNGEIEFGNFIFFTLPRSFHHCLPLPDNVSFSYDGRKQALSSVSFKVPKGSSVALVGESGSGKSTILRLLYRFYDLKDGCGRILVDGKDVRSVTRASLRRAIGAVPQDPVLFNSTIEYNIASVCPHPFPSSLETYLN
jgi:ABC-type transport system involved in Fe-S cluster assembly fused permease/ATPase subunit